MLHHLHPLRDLKGLAAFTDRTRKAPRPLVVFLGARRQRIDNVEVVPLEEFLASLPG